jgi:hypothetical protein
VDSGASELFSPFGNTNSAWMWKNEFWVQNVGSANGTAILSFYDFSGNLVQNASATIPAWQANYSRHRLVSMTSFGKPIKPKR